jgi:HSP20 family molecular chaperone IbpA
MSNVMIRKLNETALPALFRGLEELFDGVRQRAYGLYERRGAESGHDLENWLDAERQLIWSPPAEMVETETEYRIRVIAPDFHSADVWVTATAKLLIVEGDNHCSCAKNDGRVVFSEFARRKLLRCFTLAHAIDVERVTGTLSRGELTIIAPKSAVTDTAEQEDVAAAA